MKTPDPRSRFSDRVANYVKYRPGYPRGLIDFMIGELGIGAESHVADIGSGTGIFAQCLLERGVTVWGVEPNDEMRAAGEELLQKFPHFRSVEGDAENSGLVTGSVDVVTAAQAFHWFDPEKFRRECLRILKTSGPVMLVWNKRLTTETQFLLGYEELLNRYATDYQQVNHANLGTAAFRSFFGGSHYQTRHFPNVQSFDFEGLKGRLMSSSYAPMPGHPNFAPMIKVLEDLFDAHQETGHVQFLYETQMVWGTIE